MRSFTTPAIGQATFTPLPGGHARFDVTIEGVTARTTLERMRS